MRLIDYLDKGASLGTESPCLTMAGRTLNYRDVQEVSWRVARALHRSGVRPGEKVAILSANDPIAFACVFGISRAGAVWCPINPRNEAAENRELLDLMDCTCLIFQQAFAPLVEQIRYDLLKLTTLICLDASVPFAVPFDQWLNEVSAEPWQADPADDVIMIAGTGGTTGKPKGVMLTGRNIETMSALTLMSYPFEGRTVYLALAPLTHAAGVLCFPIMTLGGEIIIMPKPDLAEFLALIEKHRVTHTFLPPTLIYMLLRHPDLASKDLTSMISTMAPQQHVHADGSLARERFSSAGRPTPLVSVAIMDGDGNVLPAGERGEIVVRGSLVMAGYYKNPSATEEAGRFGWHHTGDIGYLDADNYLFIVDRAKDMIITGGFNVYSAEVEQALMEHPAVQDCAVVGLPDDTWGERVTAVVQLRPGYSVTESEVRAFVKARIGSVKAPKQVDMWPDLPRSKVGKVLKSEVKVQLLIRPAQEDQYQPDRDSQDK